MLRNLEHANRVAQKFGVCVEDTLFIALNAMGLRNDLTSTSRMRFYARLYDRPEKEFRFILSTGRKHSPFSVRNAQLFFGDKPLAAIRDTYDDAAVIGYFRGNKDVITLNSNSRSVCTGCVFCPNTLEGSSDPTLITKSDLVKELLVLGEFNGMSDLSSIREVNISTGCFEREARAIEHLGTVREALTELHSGAQIGMLTSVIRSEEGFERISELVGDFQLILTVECFGRREVILKDSKASLTTEMMPDVLEGARKNGHDTSFTYIVGLDELDVVKRNVTNMAPYVNRFPNFQVYQPHDPIMDVYAASGAQNIEFYLEARKTLETIFNEFNVRPESYANYRPLWYFEFADESLVTEKDRTVRLDDGHIKGYTKIVS